MKIINRSSPQVKVMAGLPVYNGMMHAGFVRSLMDLACRGFFADILWAERSSLIPMARNWIAASFLESDCDYLLFLDCDLVFEANTVARLLAHDKELVAGIYPRKEIGGGWLVQIPPENEPDEKTGLVQATYASTGCMLIHRTVFETIINRFGPELEYTISYGRTEPRKEHDFFRCGVVDGLYYSEDFYFCRQWRDVGGEVWIDTKARCEHIGQITYPLDGQELEQALAANVREGYQLKEFSWGGGLAE